MSADNHGIPFWVREEVDDQLWRMAKFLNLALNLGEKCEGAAAEMFLPEIAVLALLRIGPDRLLKEFMGFLQVHQAVGMPALVAKAKEDGGW